MIYKITFSCDEVDGFRRVFNADSDATFLELHAAILKSVNFPDDQMTSFFMCNERWEKEQEVTLLEMGSSFEYDNMIMEYLPDGTRRVRFKPVSSKETSQAMEQLLLAFYEARQNSNISDLLLIPCFMWIFFAYIHIWMGMEDYPGF